MIPIKKAFSSSVGRKLIMAFSGLALVGFVITHLLGNLSLFSKDGTAFNQYAAFLQSLGKGLLLAEGGLLLAFLMHIVTGWGVSYSNQVARPVGYRALKTKGGVSKNNVSSRNMVITGSLLLAFLILHIWQFKFGPGIDEGYAVEHQGETIRDLHRWVYEVFSQPLYVGIYTGAMLMLGAHLRHGFWSAFQSLGAMNARFTRLFTLLGLAVALVLSVGFLMIPIWIFFDLGGKLL